MHETLLVNDIHFARGGRSAGGSAGTVRIAACSCELWRTINRETNHPNLKITFTAAHPALDYGCRTRCPSFDHFRSLITLKTSNMPRLVRREPLMKRIKDHLDPYDFLLQLAETINDDAYDEWLKGWATSIGIGLNVLFILAKLANKPSIERGRDDVFGDFEGKSGSGWFGWIVSICNA